MQREDVEAKEIDLEKKDDTWPEVNWERTWSYEYDGRGNVLYKKETYRPLEQVRGTLFPKDPHRPKSIETFYRAQEDGNALVPPLVQKTTSTWYTPDGTKVRSEEKEYDERGNLIRERFSDWLLYVDLEYYGTVYEYDENARCVKEIAFSKSKKCRVRDDGGKVFEIDGKESTRISKTYEYDEKGRLVREVAGNSPIDYEYDENDRCIGKFVNGVKEFHAEQDGEYWHTIYGTGDLSSHSIKYHDETWADEQGHITFECSFRDGLEEQGCEGQKELFPIIRRTKHTYDKNGNNVQTRTWFFNWFCTTDDKTIRDFDASGRLIHTKLLTNDADRGRDAKDSYFSDREREAWQDFDEAGRVVHRKVAVRGAHYPKGKPAAVYEKVAEDWFEYDEHGNETLYRICGTDKNGTREKVARSTWEYDSHGNPVRRWYILAAE